MSMRSFAWTVFALVVALALYENVVAGFVSRVGVGTNAGR